MEQTASRYIPYDRHLLPTDRNSACARGHPVWEIPSDTLAFGSTFQSEDCGSIMSSQLSYAFNSSIRNDCKFNPKRYHLSDENQRGSLQLGRRKFPLRVIEMSACEFVAIIDAAPVAKLKIGGTARLLVLEGDWKVTILEKALLPNGQIQLSMEQVDEEVEPDVPRTSIFASSRSVAVGSRDPILPLAIVVVVVITILIAPSLGGKWGTSQAISDGAQEAWRFVTSGFKP
jgi:hypothetical protein